MLLLFQNNLRLLLNLRTDKNGYYYNLDKVFQFLELHNTCTDYSLDPSSFVRFQNLCIEDVNFPNLYLFKKKLNELNNQNAKNPKTIQTPNCRKKSTEKKSNKIIKAIRLNTKGKTIDLIFLYTPNRLVTNRVGIAMFTLKLLIFFLLKKIFFKFHR